MAITRRAFVVSTAALLLLAGCGFRLRTPQPVPFRTIALRGFGTRSPLGEELRRALRSEAEVVDSEAAAQVVLEVLTDARDDVVVASTAAGQVREVQLRVRFKFRVLTPGGRILLAPAELMQSRDMSYNETNALAKEQETETLYRAMQSDLVAQVMHQLSALHL
jgi:LPS-assembly lipoprotein